jgi:hypothetical protein
MQELYCNSMCSVCHYSRCILLCHCCTVHTAITNSGFVAACCALYAVVTAAVVITTITTAILATIFTSAITTGSLIAAAKEHVTSVASSCYAHDLTSSIYAFLYACTTEYAHACSHDWHAESSDTGVGFARWYLHTKQLACKASVS